MGEPERPRGLNVLKIGPSCEPDEPFFFKWGGLVVLSLALAIILIDATLLNVSLKAIIDDLNTDIQHIQWVITAYSLTLAALTITGGRLGDLFGRKRMFMLGAGLFGVGSFIASISTSVPMLIAGESIIEGVGAALMLPATASLLVSKFHGRDRAIAFGYWGGVAAASTAIGPLLGGWLTTNYSWRWGFRINIGVVLVLLAGSVLIAECFDKEEKPTLDWTGVLLSSVGLFALVFGIIESGTYGWWRTEKGFSEFGVTLHMGDVSITPVAIGVGLALLALFFVWERHVENKGRTPLVSLELFRNRQFTAGMTTVAVTSMGQTGLIFSIPVFLQAVRGTDAFHTGLALVPSSIAAFIAAPVASMASQRIPAKYIIQGGLMLNAISYIVLRQALSVNATAIDLAPGLVLQGMGLGAVLAQVNNVTLSAVSVQQAGEAAGVNNTGRQLGATLGTAIIGAVLISTISVGLVKGIEASRVIPSQLKTQVAEAVSAQTSAVEFGRGAEVGAKVPAPIKEEIARVSHIAITAANRRALLLGTYVALVGVLVSFLLPSRRELEIGVSAAHHPELAEDASLTA